MSKLQELIQKLCPDGVEYKKLGEIATIKNGRDYKHLGKGNVPVYGSGGIMTYVDTYVYNKPTVLIPRKGSLGNLFYVDTPFWNVDTIFYTEVDTQQIDVKYLYYLLAKNHLENLNKAGGVPSLTQSILNKIMLPVPPLEVQEEIVRILDHFTNLAAELQAELQARKEQYEYYRNKLLAFAKTDGVEYKKLGEVCEFQRGRTITAKEAVDGDVPVIAGGQNPAYYHNVANRQGKTVVVAGSGAYAGFVTYWEIPIFVSDAFSVNPNGNLDIKYLYYYLRNIQEKIHATKKGSGVPHVYGSSIAKFEIPVPSLTEQERIVSILDKFEALVNDLSQGLPAEIAAVQEQYEYYRNKLLSFPRVQISA